MCMECEEIIVEEEIKKERVLSGKVKICKTCGEEKPIEEFSSKGKGFTDSQCRVCGSLSRKNIDYSLTDWTLKEDTIITDFIINERGKYINELLNVLSRDLREICNRISYGLKIKSSTFPLEVKFNCESCGKDIILKPSSIVRNEHSFCSNECSHEFKKGKNPHKIIGIGKCMVCDTPFDILNNIPNQKFCSNLCKSRYYSQNNLDKIEIECTNCKKKILKNKGQIKKYNNNYCSLECELEYKHNQAYEMRSCEICGENFECLKSSTKRFCSTQCQGKWQSTILGVDNPRFSQDLIICESCGEEFYEKQYKINTDQHHFCSDVCRQKWFAEVWSQTDEWKEISKIRAVRILEEGLVAQVNSGCQIKINKLLDELKISYTNEKGFTYFTIDNYLNDYNLAIEVMGGYWHCDNRHHAEINYEVQVHRIKMDKIKHSYIKNNHGIEVLYLWEYDIKNSIDICKKLILEYIKKNNSLKSYHSFNYVINKNNLKLSDDIIIPYMDWDKNDLNKIIDTSVKEKMSKKQEDKWTKFKCEYCDKEKEELTCHYEKNEHHFCSSECYNMSKRKRIIVKCSHCGRDKEIKESDYKRHKSKIFFCNDECSDKYYNIICKCENCNKDFTKKKAQYLKSISHFCSYKCFVDSKSKDKIIKQ